MPKGVYERKSPPWNKGLPWGEATKIKFRKAQRSRSLRGDFALRRGENHPSWRGDKVCQSRVHQWVRRECPPPPGCEECGRVGSLDLANISGVYDRQRVSYKYLCRRCHMLSDGRIEKLKALQPAMPSGDDHWRRKQKKENQNAEM